MNGWSNLCRAVPQHYMRHSLSGISTCCGRIARRGLLLYGSGKGFRIFQPAGSIAVCTTVVFALGRAFLRASSGPLRSQTPVYKLSCFALHANAIGVEYTTSALILSFFVKTPSNNCMVSSLKTTLHGLSPASSGFPPCSSAQVKTASR